MVDRSSIVTPEGVLLEFEPAHVGSRMLAMCVDLAVQGLALVAIFAVLALGSVGEGLPEPVTFIFGVVAVFAAVIGYPIVLETATRGRTVGKIALGLRVVTIEGGPVRFRHATIRAALGLVDFYLVPGAPVAILMVLVSRRRQRLGDLVAGTIVLRERSHAHEVAVFDFPTPPGQEGFVGRLDVSNLDDERYALVRSFLLRVFDLSADARAATAARLGGAVADHLAQERPSDMHPEVYLACVAAAYQARERAEA